MWRNFWLAEYLFVSQVGLCPHELATYTLKLFLKYEAKANYVRVSVATAYCSMYGKNTVDSVVEFSSVGVSYHQQECCKTES
jgi:hypothetical protein